MPDAPNTAPAGQPPARRRRAWSWFAAGFLLVFVGTAVTVTGYAMSPRGDAVVVAPLWKLYLTEIERGFGPTTLGAGSGRSSGLLPTVLVHLLCSAAGGAAALATRWAVRRARGRS